MYLQGDMYGFVYVDDISDFLQVLGSLLYTVAWENNKYQLTSTCLDMAGPKLKKKKNLSVYSRFRFLDSVCLKWVYLKQWPKVSVNTNTAYKPPPTTTERGWDVQFYWKSKRSPPLRSALARAGELKWGWGPPCLRISFDEVMGTGRGLPWVLSRPPEVWWCSVCMSWANHSTFTGGEAETKAAGKQLVYFRRPQGVDGESSHCSPELTCPSQRWPFNSIRCSFNTYFMFGAAREIKLGKCSLSSRDRLPSRRVWQIKNSFKHFHSLLPPFTHSAKVERKQWIMRMWSPPLGSLCSNREALR